MTGPGPWAMVPGPWCPALKQLNRLEFNSTNNPRPNAIKLPRVLRVSSCVFRHVIFIFLQHLNCCELISKLSTWQPGYLVKMLSYGVFQGMPGPKNQGIKIRVNKTLK